MTAIFCCQLLISCKHGCQVWPLIGPDSPQMGEIWENEFLCSCPRFVQFGVNLAQLVVKSDIAGCKYMMCTDFPGVNICQWLCDKHKYIFVYRESWQVSIIVSSSLTISFDWFSNRLYTVETGYNRDGGTREKLLL